MNIDTKLLKILEKGELEKGLTKEECVYLLSFDENSLESRITSAVADKVMRRRLDNSGVISLQLGIDIEPCEGNCKFCNFGKDHTNVSKSIMPLEDIDYKVRHLSRFGDLQSVFLMTTHKYDFDNLLKSIKTVRNANKDVEIGINIGDANEDIFKEVKRSGVNAIYHACRIREGVDTSLAKDDRIRTMENAKNAGLDVYTCCEPIGPEHTLEEIVDAFFVGIEQGCKQNAVMRRVAVPGSPMANLGQITEIRMGQMCAVFSLATLQVDGFRFMMTHEPNQYGFVSGANNVAAECGGNPRDTCSDTSNGRGWTMDRCRRVLYDSGFRNLIRGDGTKVRLDKEYIDRTSQ